MLNQILPWSEDRECKVLPCCCICGKIPAEGIRGVIKLKKAFICKKCEEEIVHLDIDSAQYEVVKEKIKKILK
ncbi:Inhibitor of sigma-G Gin [Thermosyntropha lipolytica DSM 11003]|uniref:Inhibitor of sigma-G Gin n=1 Tax=Thermosyntropha lipolytica DSM 11003 TaxID=1123382 RepID=A0A1M5JM68_9FIRM|nr:sigma factor G inhibitor Gin [Thermosyntropha lipolytica]SHG41611.1 Inhibitor of sigma-G Gin [Thermosyntropha lipolytica DSM 11003]